MCVYTHVSVCICVPCQACMLVCMRISGRACTHTYWRRCMHACMHACKTTCTRPHLPVHVTLPYIRVHMSICIQYPYHPGAFIMWHDLTHPLAP